MRIEKSFIEDIKSIVSTARNRTYAAINFYMVETYWRIGERIVMEEQKGEKRAEYGEYLIRELSKRLTAELGKGFDVTNLKNFRYFYLAFLLTPIQDAVRPELQKNDSQPIEKRDAVRTLSPGDKNAPKKKGRLVRGFSETDENTASRKQQTLSGESHINSESGRSHPLRKELTWTHYRLIMRVDTRNGRQFYMNEAADNNWSTRVLQRNINTLYYDRILSTKNKSEALTKAGLLEKQSPADFIKDPYIFEFLKIPEAQASTEQQLESALIENLKDFLLELGKGFCFVKRQYRINTETKTFYIDLVFYNHILKCFALFDLKTGELTHQDVGQMDMYVRMFDDLQRSDSDNPTIGVVLCTSKDATIVKYSVLNGNEQLFATKYRSCLPSEQELVQEIERNKFILEEKLKTTAIQ